MNETRKLFAKTCIGGLQELILDILVEEKEKGEGLGQTEISRRTGIRNQFRNLDDMSWATNFTNILLLAMQEAKLVKNYGVKGKPCWKITDKEFQKRSKDDE